MDKVKEIIFTKESLQLGIILLWCIILQFYFSTTDFISISMNILRPPIFKSSVSHDTNVINNKYEGTSSKDSHFLIITENESHLLITEYSDHSICAPKNAKDILDSNMVQNNNEVAYDLNTLINNVIIEPTINKRYINLNYASVSGVDDFIRGIINNIASIFWAMIIAIILLWCGFVYSVYKSSSKYSFIFPYLIYSFIALIGILQATVVSKLGGILICPLGNTASSIIPVLFYQSFTAYRDWNSDAKIKYKFVYWLPFIFYFVGHILAEIYYRNSMNTALNAFLQHHFVSSYYYILGFAIIFSVSSLLIKKISERSINLQPSNG